MNAPIPNCRPHLHRQVAGVASFVIALPAAAGPSIGEAPLRVAVYANHFRIDEARFPNLAELDKALAGGPQTPRRYADAGVVRLDRCGSASQALLAAVAHFQDRTRGVIEIRTWTSDAPACTPAAHPWDPGYLATDSHGRSIMP